MSDLYKYKAIDNRGKIRKDYIKAENALDLEQRLSGMNLDLISFIIKKSYFNFTSCRGITRKELINFTFQIQQLSKSGVGILDALIDLRDSLPSMHIKEVLSGIVDEIRGGKTFSDALSQFPNIFDSVYVSLIKVGEETGCLPTVMSDIAETLKWNDELISQTRKIMIYPAIVSLVIIAVISYLMIFLVPELIPFIENMGGDIPVHTRALINTSWFLGQFWYLIFGLPIISYSILHFSAKNNPDIRLTLDRIKLRLYIFGPIILKTNLARFANYFAMMYASGLTVIDSLKISESLMNNSVLTHSIIEIREKISTGEKISDSFSAYNIYPPLVIRMLQTGETTGALDDALLNISYFYNREVTESINQMESAISPVLTIIMGSIMLWIMSAVLGPIYDSLTTLQL
jgi:type IV pilus assembly protein PilC